MKQDRYERGAQPLLMTHMTYDPQKERGITLIELLITVLLISTLFFFAQQTYQNLQRSLYEEVIVFDLMQQLKIAKNLASIEDRALTLCGSLDGKSCVDTQQKVWQGWLLFYDDLATFTPPSEKIISYQPSKALQDKGFYLQTTANIGGGIHFKARREYAYGMARSLANGRIRLCYQAKSAHDHPQQMHYALIINVYGYFRLSKEKGACP